MHDNARPLATGHATTSSAAHVSASAPGLVAAAAPESLSPSSQSNLDTINNALPLLQTKKDARSQHDALVQKLDNMDAKVDRLDKKMERVKRKMNNLEDKTTAIQKKTTNTLPADADGAIRIMVAEVKELKFNQAY
ncbi:hypothetical protein IAT38_005850 [Cryptococcus sp. DSM 104549]